jgi:hypothetical protein
MRIRIAGGKRPWCCSLPLAATILPVSLPVSLPVRPPGPCRPFCRTIYLALHIRTFLAVVAPIEYYAASRRANFPGVMNLGDATSDTRRLLAVAVGKEHRTMGTTNNSLTIPYIPWVAS